MLAQSVLALLRDETKAPDAELPRSGVALETERMISSAFIRSADYGTRSSTHISIDRGRQVRLLGLKDPLAGHDVVLSVDGRAQNAAQELLKGHPVALVVHKKLALVVEFLEGLSAVTPKKYAPSDFTLSGKATEQLGMSHFMKFGLPKTDAGS